MSNISRRYFLKVSGASVATTGATIVSGVLVNPGSATESSRISLDYPIKKIAHTKTLVINTPISFNYQDSSSPCVLIKMGYSVTGGVDPDKDIVAYSILCTHMSCPVAYDTSSKNFKCPCHFSVFDTETGRLGKISHNLPRQWIMPTWAWWITISCIFIISGFLLRYLQPRLLSQTNRLKLRRRLHNATA